MGQREKREAWRRGSLNLLDFVVLAEQGGVLVRGLGRTLNVSEKGLLMETAERVDAGRTLLVTLGLGEQMVEIQGRVVHAEPSGQNLFAAGVEFAAMNRTGKKVLKRYLEDFNRIGHA